MGASKAAIRFSRGDSQHCFRAFLLCSAPPALLATSREEQDGSSPGTSRRPRGQRGGARREGRASFLCSFSVVLSRGGRVERGKRPRERGERARVNSYVVDDFSLLLLTLPLPLLEKGVKKTTLALRCSSSRPRPLQGSSRSGADPRARAMRPRPWSRGRTGRVARGAQAGAAATRRAKKKFGPPAAGQGKRDARAPSPGGGARSSRPGSARRALGCGREGEGERRRKGQERRRRRRKRSRRRRALRHHLGEYDRDRRLSHRRHQPRELRGPKGPEEPAPGEQEAAPEEQGKRGQQRREQQRKRGRKGYKSQQEAEIRQSATVEGLMRLRLCRIRNSKDRRQDLAGEDVWPGEEPLLVAAGLKG